MEHFCRSVLPRKSSTRRHQPSCPPRLWVPEYCFMIKLCMMSTLLTIGVGMCWYRAQPSLHLDGSMVVNTVIPDGRDLLNFTHGYVIRTVNPTNSYPNDPEAEGCDCLPSSLCSTLYSNINDGNNCCNIKCRFPDCQWQTSNQHTLWHVAYVI